MLRKILKSIPRNDWKPVETHRGTTNTNYGDTRGFTQKFCLFVIEYSPSRDIHRVKCTSEDCYTHPKYQTVVERVISMNLGGTLIDQEDLPENKVIDYHKEVGFVMFPLSIPAQEVRDVWQRNDRVLKEAIERYSLDVPSKSILATHDNILVHGNQYTVALWNVDIKNMPNMKRNPPGEEFDGTEDVEL